MSQSLVQHGSPITPGLGLPPESKDRAPAARMSWHRSPRVSEDPFEYRALKKSTEIRLIRVCRKKVEGSIACKIYHFGKNTQRIARYHALSYVWGDSQQTRRVYLQGHGTGWHSFPLHENLWRFLDYVWRHKKFTRLFWTDFICLNQKSPEEKAQQIPRMFTIYCNAVLVVAWLQSPEQEQEHPGLGELVRWSDGLKPAQVIWPYESLREEIELRFAEFDDHRAWEQLMTNEYWQRAWIVQEVMAAKKVCVTFEDVSIDFDRLPALLIPYRTHWESHVVMAAQEHVFWTLFKNRAGAGKVPLWTILLDGDRYKCSRPADRVYGFLGILSDHDDGSSPGDHIKIDYDKPELHVFLDALLESSPPLEWYRVGYRSPESWGAPAGGFDVVSRLEGYMMSSTTTQRHQKLARFALKALKAIEILGLVSFFRPLMVHSNSLLESMARTKLKPTLDQSAALVGIMLTGWCEANAETAGSHCDVLMANRLRRGLASSPWRCKAHQSHYGDYISPASNEVEIGCVSVKWNLEAAVQACGKKSQTCDASTMTFEIPGIGFRMLLEPPGALKPWVEERFKYQWRLSLHLVGSEDPTMERLKISWSLGQDLDLPE